MNLKKSAVKNALPKDRPYRLHDGGNLYLLVNPNGFKLWSLDYKIGDRRKTLALGKYTKSACRKREKRPYMPES